MGFASVKEVIRRLLEFEDRFQAIFVLFELFIGIFAKNYAVWQWGWHMGSTEGVQGLLNVGTMLLLIALLNVASIGGTI